MLNNKIVLNLKLTPELSNTPLTYTEFMYVMYVTNLKAVIVLSYKFVLSNLLPTGTTICYFCGI